MIGKFIGIVLAVMFLPIGCLSAQSARAGGEMDLPKDPKSWIRLEYEKLFSLYIESNEFHKKCDAVASQLDSRDKTARFFMAGFIRGCLEYRDYESFEKAVGLAHDHLHHSGRNVAEEYRGWQAGCEFGHSQGERIYGLLKERFRTMLGGHDAVTDDKMKDEPSPSNDHHSTPRQSPKSPPPPQSQPPHRKLPSIGSVASE